MATCGDMWRHVATCGDSHFLFAYSELLVNTFDAVAEAHNILIHSQVDVAPIDLKSCVYVGGNLQESRTNLRLQAGKPL